MKAIVYAVYALIVIVAAGVRVHAQDIAMVSPMSSVSNAASMVTVRDLVESGQAKIHIINQQSMEEQSEFELVLVDVDGRSIGGYGPPYLPSQTQARSLWRDFVTANLHMMATPEQVTVLETRKAEDQSFAIGFALDHSASMTTPRAIRMQRAVQNALRTFSPQDYVSVVKFTGSVETEVELSKEREEYLSQFKVNGLQSRNNGTAIYDAAMASIEQLVAAPDVSKRVLVIFTDGEDESSDATVQDVIEAGKKHDVSIHVITYGISDDREVKLITDATNGKLYKLQDVYDFDRVFLGIYNALRHAYTVTVKHNKDRADNRVNGATMTVSGQGSGSVKTPEILAMLPKHRVTVPNVPFDGLILNIELAFEQQTTELQSDDISLLDSIATVMIQKSDIVLEILSSSTSTPSQNDSENFMHRRAQAVRDLLIRRGVPSSRIQSYAGKSASASPGMKFADPNKTTFVFTKM